MSQNPITGREESGPTSGIRSGADEEVAAGGLVFSGSPASHILLFTGVTLASNMQLLRAIGVAPKRTSGWTAFTGTITTTPAQTYTDYRELHTAGVAEVLGSGSFVFMDSGASCASLFGGQDIAEVDAGATVLTAGGNPAVGIFGRWIKVLLNGETFNSGGVAAALFLSFQANVTAVQGEDTSLINGEVASGQIRSILRLRHSAAAMAVNLLEIDSEVAPVGDGTTGYNDPNAGTCQKHLTVKIGSTLYMIPLYQHT